MRTPKFIKDLIKNPTMVFSALGAVTGAVFLNLLQQFDIACENDINVENTFMTNYDNLQEFLGMKQDIVDTAIYTLGRLELIDVHILPEETRVNWVVVYIEEINDFFKGIKQHRKISMRDELLKNSANTSRWKLNKSTKKLQSFIQQNSDKVIPSAVYPFCNGIIQNYEQQTKKSFTKIPHIWDEVLDVLQNPEFMPNQFQRWLSHIVFSHLVND